MPTLRTPPWSKAETGWLAPGDTASVFNELPTPKTAPLQALVVVL